jgi:hypothetical protein
MRASSNIVPLPSTIEACDVGNVAAPSTGTALLLSAFGPHVGECHAISDPTHQVQEVPRVLLQVDEEGIGLLQGRGIIVGPLHVVILEVFEKLTVAGLVAPEEEGIRQHLLPRRVLCTLELCCISICTGQSRCCQFAVDEAWILTYHPATVFYHVNVVLEHLMVLMACGVAILGAQVKTLFGLVEYKWTVHL